VGIKVGLVLEVKIIKVEVRIRKQTSHMDRDRDKIRLRQSMRLVAEQVRVGISGWVLPVCLVCTYAYKLALVLGAQLGVLCAHFVHERGGAVQTGVGIDVRGDLGACSRE
jgi:hypothetical protein